MLQNKQIEFLDGSIGSYIRSLSDAPKNDVLWGSELVVSDPDLVKRVHREYVDAGSTLITTCTYQASIQGYAEHFKVSQQEAMGQIASSVGLAHECLENSTKTAPFKVVGVIGSFGAHLCNMSEYDGSFVKKFTNDQMEKWHDDFIVALTCGTYKPDIIGFETIPVIAELECILRVIARYPQHSFYIAFSCSSESTLCSGEQFVDALKIVSQTGLKNLAAIGINCTSVLLLTPLLKSAHDVIIQLNIPILIMPNLKKNLSPVEDGVSRESFKKENRENYETSTKGSSKQSLTAEDVFFEVLQRNCTEWYQLGARWFGGCCGTKPEHISRMKKVVEQSLNLAGSQTLS